MKWLSKEEAKELEAIKDKLRVNRTSEEEARYIELTTNRKRILPCIGQI